MTSVEDTLVEEDYKFLFESTFKEASVGLFHISLEGELVRINDELCRLLGYQRNELKSKDFEEISHPEDFEEEKQYIDDIMDGKIEQYSMKKRYIKKDLSTIWCKLKVKIVKDNNENPQFLLGIVEDISQQVQAERESRRLSTIVEVQQNVVRAELDIDETINRVSYAAMKVTSADGATVEFVEEDEIVYRGSCGNLEEINGFRLPAEKTLSAQAYNEKNLINCHDMKTDDRIELSDTLKNIGFRSGLLVPLTYKKKSFGILKVVSEKPYYFQEDDEQTIQLLSGLLASQVFHSIQYEDTLLQSKTDELTGLSNRRQLMEDLQEEIERSKRYDHELSLVLLDIDRFKLINDTHGHVVGDEVLQEIGRILDNKVREVDIAGRYGGEEFVLLTPEIGTEGAKILANRIRESLQEMSFTGKDDDEFTVTLSAGISTFEQGDTATNLINRADEALYEAKESGRNKVVIS